MADVNIIMCVLDFELPVPGKPCGCSKTTHHFFNLFKASVDQMKPQLFKIYKDRIPTHVRLYIEHLLATQEPGQLLTTSPVEVPIDFVPLGYSKTNQAQVIRCEDHFKFKKDAKVGVKINTFDLDVATITRLQVTVRMKDHTEPLYMDGTSGTSNPKTRCVFTIWQDNFRDETTYLQEESGHITAHLLFEPDEDPLSWPRICFNTQSSSKLNQGEHWTLQFRLFDEEQRMVAHGSTNVKSYSRIHKKHSVIPEMVPPDSSDTPLEGKSDDEILQLIQECNSTIWEATDQLDRYCREQHKRISNSKGNLTIKNEHVETFAINQKRRGIGNTLRYHAKVCKLRQLGITCGKCGSRGDHVTAKCEKSKEELECSGCKSRGRPYIGHVDQTCFTRLELPKRQRVRSASNTGT